ncbi:MAG: hypothetical protein ACPLPT_10795 [Moorellales bacterium]
MRLPSGGTTVAAVFSSAVVGGILTEFFPLPWLVILRGFVALLALLAAFPGSTRQTRLVTFALLGAGFLIGGRSITPVVLVNGLGEMLPVVSLLACASTMNIPLRLGGYGSIMEDLLLRGRHNHSRRLAASLVAYILAALASLGSVPIAYYVLSRATNGPDRVGHDYFVSSAITRGFAMAVLWSPVAANVGIALKYTHLSWARFAPRALLFSLIGLVVGALLARPSYRPPEKTVAAGPTIAPARVGGLGGLLAGTVLLIAVFEKYLGAGALGSISLACVAAGVAWGALTGNLGTVSNELTLYFSKSIRNLGDQILLLVGAGFFATILGGIGVANSLAQLVANLGQTYGPGTALLLLPAAIIVLAILGVHPFASTVILAKSLHPDLVGLPPINIALALATGAALAFTVSPFTAVTLFVAAQTGRPSLEIGLKWNGPFVLALLAVFLLLNFVMSF